MESQLEGVGRDGEIDSRALGCCVKRIQRILQDNLFRMDEEGQRSQNGGGGGEILNTVAVPKETVKL